MICWSLSVTCVNLVLQICRVDENVSNFCLRIGMMRNFCVQMICGGVDMVCYSRIDGSNSCMWNLSIMSYSWSGDNYPCVVTCYSLYMNHDDLSCGVCKNVIVTWKDFSCPCLHKSVWSLTWLGGFCVVWIGNILLGFSKEVSCVDNPLQCDHTHHISNI